MREKLKEIALRYEDLQAQLGDPAVYGDSERLKAVTRELKELEPVVTAYRAYRQAEADLAGAEELLHDPDFRDLAQEELAADLNNSVVTIAALVPWSIACAVPLSVMHVGVGALPYSVFLYLVPLCYLLVRRKHYCRS